MPTKASNEEENLVKNSEFNPKRGAGRVNFQIRNQTLGLITSKNPVPGLELFMENLVGSGQDSPQPNENFFYMNGYQNRQKHGQQVSVENMETVKSKKKTERQVLKASF